MNNIVLAASDKLRVVFDYRVDRWGHAIEVRREDQWIAAYSSIEGGSSEDWPPSPAFQHIHRQSFAQSGPTALLVGKAGASHWSAAVEADRESGVLRFDIACRLSVEPTLLGSTYSMFDDRNADAWNRPRIELATLNDAVRRALETNAMELSIRVSSESCSKPTTIRWKYVVNVS